MANYFFMYQSLETIFAVVGIAAVVSILVGYVVVLIDVI